VELPTTLSTLAHLKEEAASVAQSSQLPGVHFLAGGTVWVVVRKKKNKKKKRRSIQTSKAPNPEPHLSSCEQQ
jgi:hypothetical protein